MRGGEIPYATLSWDYGANVLIRNVVRDKVKGRKETENGGLGRVLREHGRLNE
jgi:hypothetical protein